MRWVAMAPSHRSTSAKTGVGTMETSAVIAVAERVEDGAGRTGATRPTLDQETLAELSRLHGPYLLRALIRVTSGDRGRAEDIMQETLIRAWQHPEAFTRGPEHGRPWLITVARRIAIDHYRMQAARAQEVLGQSAEEHAAKDHF